MYNQLYLWANNNFKLLCICILVVVFAMVFISALMKHRRRMHICWISLFIVYLLMLAFITVISHSDIHQSVVVGRLRFHYIFISKMCIRDRIMGMTILLSTMWFGVMAMAYSLLVSNVLSQIINSWPNRKLLNYSYLDQVKDFAPGILLAVFMGVCVYFIGYIPLPIILTLVIQIIAGATIFIALSAILKLEEFELSLIHIFLM